MSNVNFKLFCIYHKQTPVWKSDCIEPIQSGCALASTDLKLLRDDSGDNISRKNANYGELTVWYWVWKNYIPTHPSLDYVGFCHYRRFLSFTDERKAYISVSKFAKLFAQFYNKANIGRYLDADILLPPIHKVGKKSVLESFYEAHGKEDIDMFIDIVKKHHPSHADVVDTVLQGHEAYFFLNFVIKKDLFVAFMEWLFPLLEELEQNSNWEGYKSYASIRMPAYIVERFFTVWINIMQRERGITIKHRHLHLIHQDLPLWKKIAKPFLFVFPHKKRIEIRKRWREKHPL